VFVALVIQHVMNMHRILLSYVACPAPPFFPHYLTNDTFFERKKKKGY